MDSQCRSRPLSQSTAFCTDIFQTLCHNISLLHIQRMCCCWLKMRFSSIRTGLLIGWAQMYLDSWCIRFCTFRNLFRTRILFCCLSFFIPCLVLNRLSLLVFLSSMFGSIKSLVICRHICLIIRGNWLHIDSGLLSRKTCHLGIFCIGRLRGQCK